jgi:hypothetical protein
MLANIAFQNTSEVVHVKLKSLSPPVTYIIGSLPKHTRRSTKATQVKRYGLGLKLGVLKLVI